MPPDGLRLSRPELQMMLDKAAEEGASRALQRIGLSDDEAATDMLALRTLLDDWRSARSSVIKAIATIITTGVLALMSAGVAIQWFSKG